MPQEQSPPAPVVLIVENDVLLHLVTASNLRDAGFEVIEAANSAEAIRILDCIPVDVLFSDIDMPGKMNGLALAQWVHLRRVDTRIILTPAGRCPWATPRNTLLSFPSLMQIRTLNTSCEAFFLHLRPAALHRFTASAT
jgi:hypothetical protein